MPDKTIVKSFTFIDSIINIYIQDTENVYIKLEDLFKTHFTVSNEIKKQSFANIYLKPIDAFDRTNNIVENNLATENLVIRTSSVKKFRLSANKYTSNKKIIYDCLHSDTVIIMETGSKDITIFCSEKSEIQLIEFIRDLIIKDQEQKGTLILHSAAAEKNGKGIIFAGSKGAGKTTTLMEFLYKNNCKMVSGDKVFLRVSNGKITLHGWPDYTHIGVGTLRRFPQLIKMIKDYGVTDIDDRNSVEKILIEPSFFNQHSDITYCKESLPLEYILFPEYIDIEEIILEELKDIDKYIIPNLEFKEDYEQAKWHDFINYRNPKRKEVTNKLVEAFSNYDAYTIKGNLNMSIIFEEGIL